MVYNVCNNVLIIYVQYNTVKNKKISSFLFSTFGFWKCVRRSFTHTGGAGRLAGGRLAGRQVDCWLLASWLLVRASNEDEAVSLSTASPNFRHGKEKKKGERALSSLRGIRPCWAGWARPAAWRHHGCRYDDGDGIFGGMRRVCLAMVLYCSMAVCFAEPHYLVSASHCLGRPCNATSDMLSC